MPGARPPTDQRQVSAFLRAGPLSYVSGWSHQVSGRCGVHSHRSFEIVFHPSGRGVSELADGTTVPFGPGDALVYAPFQRHDQAMSEPGEDVCVHVDAGAPIPPSLQACFVVRDVRDAALLSDLRWLARGRGLALPGGLERVALDHRATAVMAGLLHAATASQTAPDSADVRRAEAAHRFIAEHYQTISRIEEVAAAAGCGYGHLRHCFKARYRRSLVRWLAEVRVDRAKDLLAHSTLPLRDIAQLCGWANERYFSTVFAGLVGFPPGEFRRRT
ncbi:MAG: helix-turn-helix transcriptional regulator [Planctomycetes bacterium]|nr:helix-turn-helix transcriptional regulator [Planctomycetota bacterium]